MISPRTCCSIKIFAWFLEISGFAVDFLWNRPWSDMVKTLYISEILRTHEVVAHPNANPSFQDAQWTLNTKLDA